MGSDLNLARAFVALPGWRWMLGQPAVAYDDDGAITFKGIVTDSNFLSITDEDGDTLHREGSGSWTVAVYRVPPMKRCAVAELLPDLSGHLSCILALVREASGDPFASARHRSGLPATFPAWVVLGHSGYTEAEALYHAFKAAGGGK